MKTFPDMTFDERVAWARGYILVSIGAGKFDDAVWLICQQFSQYPKTREQVVEKPKRRRTRRKVARTRALARR